MLLRKITKEEITELPLGAFEGESIVIDDEKEVTEAIKILYKSRVIGFDTETKPAFKKGQFNEVALLQLSTLDQAFLFRLNHIGLPKVITKLLADPAVIKVGAAVHDDIKALKKLTYFQPKAFFDLNDECKAVGFKSYGVRNLSALVLGIRISKSEQLSNWETDTLSEKQIKYAATDAWACLEIYQELVKQGYFD
ncbi:3'-5' exonuclease [Penaeicola halotolerans]|uniref:3'-5' exonuclease n=1 Tax=Penaeicola halotolerans TaxID=2793196 RepID=UPI001CF7F374|nr:3'-5' exonuclease [Penaeicola halotolerans]